MIYFIQAGEYGPVKIGYVEGIDRLAVFQRLNLLQVGNHDPLVLLATLSGGLGEERELHRRFASGHLRGEWFAYDTPGLKEAIDSAPCDEGILAWQLRSDGKQLCEWCRVVEVLPPRRSLCSEECAGAKKRAELKVRRAA